MKERNKRGTNFKEILKNVLCAIVIALIIFLGLMMNDLGKYNNYKEEYNSGEDTRSYENFWDFVRNYTEEE